MDLILRVTTSNPALGLTQLSQLPLGLDVWEVGESEAIVRASEPQAERLRAMGYEVEQVYLTESYLSEFTGAATLDDTVTGVSYHSVASLENDLRELEAIAPEIAQLREIGRSVEGRPIWALRIGERRDSQRKLLFLGCHHARERLAVEVPFQLASHLVRNRSDSQIQQWLAAGEIWVAPMVNPDGHEFTRTTNRLWRKNRRRNPDGSFGVDPNRNYGYMWATVNNGTTSNVPSDDTYVGPRAFSEPETQAIRDLFGCERFRGVITYHSYSQVILYPWGYRSAPVSDPEDRATLTSLAEEMQRLIRGIHDRVYTTKQASQLYGVPVAGDTTDWTFGTYRVPSFTIELRPARADQGGFILPPSQIAPTWEENRPAALEFIRRVL
jgi:carboxypeptidase T